MLSRRRRGVGGGRPEAVGAAPRHGTAVGGRAGPVLLARPIEGDVAMRCRRCLGDASAHVCRRRAPHLRRSGRRRASRTIPTSIRSTQRATELDLRPALREQWLLRSLAFVLCRDDCKGLCPTCGADLNAGACDCAADLGWIRAGKRAARSSATSGAEVRLTALSLSTYRSRSHGRPEATYLEEEEARAQHAQDRARDRDPEVPALPGDEAPAPRLRGVRVLRR